MKKNRSLVILGLMVAVFAAYITTSASPGTYSCTGTCTGCQCWGNVGVDPIDNCCGICTNYFWYGYDPVPCCIGGMGCRVI